MSACKSCGAVLRWAKTEADKAISLDATPTPDGNVIIVKGVAVVLTKGTLVQPGIDRYTAHWATCPTAFEHRRVKR